MKEENEKRGLFERISLKGKPKKSSCCCNVELEEIPEAEVGKEDQQKEKKDGGNSCCCK
jgi:hypothetical protein